MSNHFNTCLLSKPILVDIHLARPSTPNLRLTSRVGGRLEGDFRENAAKIALLDWRCALALSQTHTYRWTGEGFDELKGSIDPLYALLYPSFQSTVPGDHEASFLIGLVTSVFDGKARRVIFNFNKQTVQWSNWDKHFELANKAWEDDPAIATVRHLGN